MSSAGQQLVAGRIPGERIATTIETADSPLVTAQTTVISLTAPLVIDRTYKITLNIGVDSQTVNDRMAVRIREDDVTGTQMQTTTVVVVAATGSNYRACIEAEFTAITTGNKTFVGTLTLSTGTGDIFMSASPIAPSYLYADYIRG